MFGRRFSISKTRIIAFAVGILIFGIMLLVSFISETIAVSKGIDDFNELKCDEFIKGRFVQGTVQELYFEFAEEWEEQSGSNEKQNKKKYYLIPLIAHENQEEIKYIAVRFSKEIDITKADNLLDEVIKCYNTGEEPISFPTFEITGKVCVLDEEIEGYLYDALIKYEWGETKEECKQYVCDYYIDCKEPASVVELFIGIMIIVLGVSIIFITLIKRR